MERNMRDIADRQIDIGDTVAYSHGQYASLHKGIVDSFTPKRVRIQREGRQDWIDVKDPNQTVIVEKACTTTS